VGDTTDFESSLITMLVLSHYQIDPILKSRRKWPSEIEISADLNRTTIAATVSTDGLHIQDQTISWKTLKTIGKNVNNCFVIEDGEAYKITTFSDVTSRAYSLYPTSNAPTMLVAGFPMHRIKNTDPHADTLEKVRALGAVTGAVLDTCTGLGYTAIEMAKTASLVMTIELDPGAQEICRDNPWSLELFSNPKIEQRIGSSFDIVPTLDEGQFDGIVHDPPTFALAGELYSAEFYAQLYRTLTLNGRLFHYIGDPDSRSGRNTTRGVIERLTAVGFSHITRQPRAFGVLAKK
jgi:predicted methyltransferase